MTYEIYMIREVNRESDFQYIMIWLIFSFIKNKRQQKNTQLIEIMFPRKKSKGVYVFKY